MITDETLARMTAKYRVAEDGCWTWFGTRNNGYGQVAIAGKRHQAHRVFYEHFVGPIPDGMVLDHLCHTADLNCSAGTACPHRSCINPRHLEPVLLLENVRRGENVRRTSCRNGHPLEGENLKIDSAGKRRCLICKRAAVRRHYKNSDGAAYFRAYRASKKAAEGAE